MAESTPRYHVFLSHNSQDKGAVEPLAVMLREKGLIPFLDKWNLVPGEPIEDALIAALDNSDSAVIFVGPGGDGPWQSEEMRDILKRAVKSHNEFRAIPVLLPNASVEALEKSFLGSRLWIEFKDVDDEDALLRLIKAIQGEAYGDETFKLPDEPAPYRGLERFERIENPEEDFFFGRDDEIRALVERLVKQRFVAVVGASGSGKSSLIRAGLTKQLAEENHPGIRRWQTITVEPGSAPFRSLAVQVAVKAGIPRAERDDWIEKSVPKWRASVDGVRQSLETLFADAKEPLLVFIDQFEELFTHRKEGEEHERISRNFVANLADIWRNGGDHVRVVVALRADFIERCLEIGPLKELLQDRTMLVGEVGDDALREIVKEPAARVGAFLEKGLMERILTDVHDQSGSLPLLEQALYELWRQRRGAWLTHEAYDTSGGVAGALNDQAQGAYKALDAAQKKLADNLFPRLITLGEGVADTRRRVRRKELYPQGVEPTAVNEVIDKLSGKDARVLVTTREGGTAEDLGSGEDFVEFTHEALLGNWEHLVELLDSERESIRKHRSLTTATEEWESKPAAERPKFLLHHGQLEITERWARDEGGYTRLNQTERQFLEESIQERTAEEERKARTTRRLKWLSIGAIAAALIMGVLGWVMYGQWQDGLKTESLFLADLAGQQISEGDAVTGALLAFEGLQDDKSSSWSQILRPYVPAAEGALDAAYLPGTWRDRIFKGGAVRKVSPDGTRIVTASEDRHSVRVYAISADGTWSAAATLDHGNNELVQVMFSPDGTRILTTAKDETARVWDAVGGAEIAVLKEYANSVRGFAVSPDDTRIVTLSQDEGTARLWAIGDSGTWIEVDSLSREKGWITSLAFSPDGTRIVTHARDSKTARLWAIGADDTWSTIARFSPENSVRKSYITSVAFSPNGTRIVTISQDQMPWISDKAGGRSSSTRNTARVWNAANGTKLAVLDGHKRRITSAVFSLDSTRIVTASEDGTARVWNAANGQVIKVLEGHDAEVTSATFRPDGERIVTTSEYEQAARLWDVQSGAPVAALKHTENVTSATFSPDGALIVTTSEGNTARVWRAGSGAPVAALKHTEDVTSAVFSPDSTRIVTTSKNDHTARVWGTDTDGIWSKIPSLGLGNNVVISFTVGPDGTHIVATTSDDGTARVWGAGADGTWSTIAHLSPVNSQLTSIAISPDGDRIVTTSDDRSARVWGAGAGADGTWTTIANLSPETSAVASIAVSSNDDIYIVTVSDDESWRVLGVDADGTWTAIGNLNAGNSELTGIAFSTDGTRILTATKDDKTARVWAIGADGKLSTIYSFNHVIQGVVEAVTLAAFSPDDTRIVTVSEDVSVALVWNAATGQKIGRLEGHTDRVTSVAFSLDGARIVTGSKDGTARVWGPGADGKWSTIARLNHGNSELVQVMFSPNGTYIVTTAEDKTEGVWMVRVWREGADSTWSTIASFSDGNSKLARIAVSSDGTRIIITAQGETARVWRLPLTQALIDRTKNDVSRCLTRDQRKQFHLTPSVPRWCYEMKKWPYHDHAKTPLPPRWYKQPFVDAEKWIVARYKDVQQMIATRSGIQETRHD